VCLPVCLLVTSCVGARACDRVFECVHACEHAFGGVRASLAHYRECVFESGAIGAWPRVCVFEGEGKGVFCI